MLVYITTHEARYEAMLQSTINYFYLARDEAKQCMRCNVAAPVETIRELQRCGNSLDKDDASKVR